MLFHSKTKVESKSFSGKVMSCNNLYCSYCLFTQGKLQFQQAKHAIIATLHKLYRLKIITYNKLSLNFVLILSFSTLIMGLKCNIFIKKNVGDVKENNKSFALQVDLKYTANTCGELFSFIFSTSIII